MTSTVEGPAASAYVGSVLIRPSTYLFMRFSHSSLLVTQLTQHKDLNCIASPQVVLLTRPISQNGVLSCSSFTSRAVTIISSVFNYNRYHFTSAVTTTLPPGGSLPACSDTPVS